MSRKDDRQTITEDIFGTFGFRLVWTYAEHWCDVKVYEVETRGNDGAPGFHRRDAPCSPDPVPDIADADTYLEGYVKWDGCAELNQGCPHWCGPADFVKHCELLRYIYTRANELMGRNPPEDGTWEEAIKDHATRTSLVMLQRVQRRADGVEMVDIPDDELTLEFPDDIQKLKYALISIDCDASDRDIEWAWLQHSLDFSAGWLQLGNAESNLKWLQTFLEDPTPPAPKLLEGGFYVGTNTDPKYPGIISGPFTVPPRLTGPNHTLWRAAGDKFVREENLEFH